MCPLVSKVPKPDAGPTYIRGQVIVRINGNFKIRWRPKEACGSAQTRPLWVGHGWRTREGNQVYGKPLFSKILNFPFLVWQRIPSNTLGMSGTASLWKRLGSYLSLLVLSLRDRNQQQALPKSSQCHNCVRPSPGSLG